MVTVQNLKNLSLSRPPSSDVVRPSFEANFKIVGGCARRTRPPKWPLLTPYGPKMKIFNFELESKLDLHFDVTFNFDGECDGDGPGS